MGRGLRWSRAGIPALACALAVGGCFGGADDEGRKRQKVNQAPTQIVNAVGLLQRAAATGDYRAVCSDLFTAAARKRAGGKDCAAQLKRRAGKVDQPQLEVRRLNLDGDRAEVILRSTADGEPPATDTLKLVRQRGRYLVDSLGGG